MDKINELELELKALKAEEQRKKSEKYEWLIGKYISQSATSVDKITKIHCVNGDYLTYNSIHIFFNENARELNVYEGESDTILVSDIEKNLISETEFLTRLNEGVNFLEKIYDNIIKEDLKKQ